MTSNNTELDLSKLAKRTRASAVLKASSPISSPKLPPQQPPPVNNLSLNTTITTTTNVSPPKSPSTIPPSTPPQYNREASFVRKRTSNVDVQEEDIDELLEELKPFDRNSDDEEEEDEENATIMMVPTDFDAVQAQQQNNGTTNSPLSPVVSPATTTDTSGIISLKKQRGQVVSVSLSGEPKRTKPHRILSKKFVAKGICHTICANIFAVAGFESRTTLASSTKKEQSKPYLVRH